MPGGTDMETAPPDTTPNWIEATADNPCPICWRSEGCRVRGNEVAWILIENGLGRRKTSASGESYCLYDLSSFRYVPAPLVALDLLKRHFFNRTDRVAFKPPWDSEACPADGGDKLDAMLKAHFSKFARTSIRWRT